MWSELETVLQAHASTSSKHAEIHDCLVECVGKSTLKNGSVDGGGIAAQSVR